MNGPEKQETGTVPVSKENESSPISMFVMPEKFVGLGSKREGMGGGNKLPLAIGGVLVLASGILFLLRDQLFGPAPVIPAPSVAKQTPESKAPLASEPPKEKAPIVEEKQEPPKEEFPAEAELPSLAVEYISARDSDQDGLTDTEELIFNTFPNRPDSDGDGHVDSAEILNFYNPTGNAPSNLASSGLVSTYENKDYEYFVFYPANWIRDIISSKKVIWSTQTEEKIEISIEDNPTKKTITEWYKEKHPEAAADLINTFTTKNGLRGVKSKNGLYIYMIKPVEASITNEAKGTLVYALRYLPGSRTELNFRTSFELMKESFTIAAPPALPEPLELAL
ncbi:MAG: hypothetical protein G01um101418_273 [Parcubacteria group bacterium Gr01-1014_18]|nr:MAG: hypothetical protein Greene041636_240 [Parcubacteria group bacterium Greene0416_36]TSC81291.1 MAG: hypothetical protein G01um101418_273 [Parcubacteria group bacterium Gr01-1014_18]TSC99313.1 MAG: hypothetical protein Greene101420_241 [Parcubacteria group bacterium Greene1014_20]TSD06850.1 MAG: hypothetical protein Greene07142_584 [Parcubacteria group bacterium Greene0714_2]